MMSRYIMLILRMTAYCYHYLVCLQRMGYFGEVTRSSALQLDEAGLEVGELLYCTVLHCTALYWRWGSCCTTSCAPWTRTRTRWWSCSSRGRATRAL